MNGKGFLVIGIILMCIGFGSVIRTVATEGISGPTSAPPGIAPSITPSSKLTAEEEEYIYYIANQGEAMFESYSRIIDLMGNPNAGSVAWISNMTEELGQLEYIKINIKMTPYPQSMIDIHRAQLSCAGHLLNAGYLRLDSAQSLFMAEQLSDFPEEGYKYLDEAKSYFSQSQAEESLAFEAAERAISLIEQKRN